MRLYLLSDSLSLPRVATAKVGAVKYEDTYPQLIANDGWSRAEKLEVIVDGQRGRTMDESAAVFRYEVCNYSPGAAVVQIGIVDCAPRVFRKWQNFLVSRLRPKFFRSWIFKFASKFRKQIIKLTPSKVYTSRPRFERSVRSIISRCENNGIALCFVGIVPAPDHYCEKSPGVGENIAAYNQILADLSDNFVDVASLVGDDPGIFLLEDGHHLNSRGHQLVAKGIIDWLRKSKCDRTENKNE